MTSPSPAKSLAIAAGPAPIESRDAPHMLDLAVAELTADQRAALAHLPFLASLDFCTMYEDQPADRAYVRLDAQQHACNAAFYRERRWLGFIRAIEFVGIPCIESQHVADLLRSRSAHVASVFRMREHASREANPLAEPHIDTAVDVIAELPSDKDAYFRSLGKQKRQQLPRYWRRVQREFTQRVAMKFRRNGEIDIENVIRLVGFNQTRMAEQGKRNETAFESQQQRRRAPLAQKSGLLCTMEADGRVLGGTFNYVHNHEAFLIVIAHDPALERLNIGHLCLWRTIEHLIELGVTRYHFFWGKKLYKSQFGGIDHQASMVFVSRKKWLAKVARRYWIARFQLPRAIRFAAALPNRLLRSDAGKHNAEVDA